MSRDNARFCRIRSQKRQHCEELGLTHFVDDRVDVHAAIHGTVEHQYLFGHATGSAHARAVETWVDVLRLIGPTVDAHATMDA